MQDRRITRPINPPATIEDRSPGHVKPLCGKILPKIFAGAPAAVCIRDGLDHAAVVHSGYEGCRLLIKQGFVTRCRRAAR